MLRRLFLLPLLVVAQGAWGQVPKTRVCDPISGFCASVNSSGQMGITGSISVSGAGDTVGSSGSLNALNAAVSVALAGQGGAGLHLSAGTLVGTIVPELSVDNGTTWVATNFITAAGSTQSSVVFGSANAATEIGIVLMGGAREARVRVSAYTSGTASGFLVATYAQTAAAASGGGGGTVTQGSSGSNAQAWWAQIGDTTNGPVAVKAASTGAAAADKSLVVQLSPNQSALSTALNVGASQTGSWSMTANAGTNLNTSALALDATAAKLNLAQGSTTSGQTGPLLQGAVTSSSPSYTTAQTSPISLTTAGAVRTDASATTQPVSGTVTANAGSGTFATQDTGNGATGSAVPARAEYIGGNKSGNLTGLSLDGSGNLNVNVAAGGASGGTSSSFGSAFPATGTAIGAKDSTGTNMAALNLDASGFLKVNVAAGGGSGGTSSSFAAAFPSTGTASGAKVVSSAPTLTAGNMEGFELSTAGRLFVDGSGVTQPVSGTVTANAGTGSFTVAQATASNLNAAVVGTGTVSSPASGTVSVVVPTTSTSGTLGALNALVSLTLNGWPGAAFTLTSSTLIGTLTPQCVAGSQTKATQFFDYSSNTLSATQVVASGTSYNLAIVPCGGYPSVQVQVTAYTSGSGTGTVYASSAAAPTAISNLTTLASGQATMSASMPVVIASNQSAVPLSQNGAPWSDNVTQLGGTSIAVGNGTTNTGTQRVTLSSDSTGQVALAAGSASVGTVGLNAGSNTIGSVKVTDGTTTPTMCTNTLAISQTALNGAAQIVAGSSGKKIYICGFYLVVTSAVSTGFVEGTGSACGTGQSNTTGQAAFGANGGISMGLTPWAIPFTTTATDALCVKTSGASDVNGWISYAQF